MLSTTRNMVGFRLLIMQQGLAHVERDSQCDLISVLKEKSIHTKDALTL